MNIYINGEQGRAKWYGKWDTSKSVEKAERSEVISQKLKMTGQRLKIKGHMSKNR